MGVQWLKLQRGPLLHALLLLLLLPGQQLVLLPSGPMPLLGLLLLLPRARRGLLGKEDKHCTVLLLPLFLLPLLVALPLLAGSLVGDLLPLLLLLLLLLPSLLPLLLAHCSLALLPLCLPLRQLPPPLPLPQQAARPPWPHSR